MANRENTVDKALGERLRAIDMPYLARSGARRFELAQAGDNVLLGSYIDAKTHNRFELLVEYVSGVKDWFSVLANLPYFGEQAELRKENCAFKIQLPTDTRSVTFQFKGAPELDFILEDNQLIGSRTLAPPPSASNILFDVSDLVYYLGHHDNLTGIQRVQACVLMGLIAACPSQPRGYLTFNNRTRDFLSVDPGYFEALLHDVSLPVAARKVAFDRMEARLGILPQTRPLATVLEGHQEARLIVHLLGAAWVNRDYFHRILELKRNYDAVFSMTVHDLIPIFARDTCDQGTAVVFEEFLRKSFLFTDHFLPVSEHTALDLHKFSASLEIRNPSISVVENGHALDEFFPPATHKARAPIDGRYVLFVSTIEGRKNHSYIFDVWARLSALVEDLPTLVCVGRFGWRAEQFLEKMLLSNNLGNKIRVMSDVSDAQLEALYANCLFSVYPSHYEGWGLPVGESLCKGKIPVLSDRSSLPEVAGEFGVYVNVNSVDDGVERIQRLIEDDKYRLSLERRLHTDFVPRTWKLVARQLVEHLNSIPTTPRNRFPLAMLGREYKLSQLPPRNLTALGYAMIAEVTSARKAAITGYINRDEDLLVAQAMREGPGWYGPEDWGTWSRYPEAAKLFYIHAPQNSSELVIYEKLRVVGTLVGVSLRVTVNGGAPQEFRIEEEKFIIRILGQVRCDSSGLAKVHIRYELSPSADLVPELEKIDARRLGLGFESTAIIDDSDIGARVSMLERLLFGGSAGRILGQCGAHSSTHTITASSQGSSRRAARSLLVGSRSGVSFVDSGDQRSLGSPAIEVGEQVLFGVGQKSAQGTGVEAILGRGWHPQEPGGVWSQGAEATLQFKLSQDTKPIFAIVAEVRCLARPDHLVRVALIVNGVIVGTEEFRDSEYRTLHYIVDQHITPEDRAFVVLLHCDRPGAPSDSGDSTDTRELGVHLRSLAVFPVRDLHFDRRYEIYEGAEVVNAFAGGWHGLEPSGTWSREDGGRIVGLVKAAADNEPPANIRMSFLGRVYGTRLTGAAKVDLLVQGQVCASLMFDDDMLAPKQVVLPLIAMQDSRLLDVRLVRRASVSPSEAEGTDDRRKLGLLLAELSFSAASLNEVQR
jgi:glycosyltransferase involved in cell wall biosynthesis